MCRLSLYSSPAGMTEKPTIIPGAQPLAQAKIPAAVKAMAAMQRECAAVPSFPLCGDTAASLALTGLFQH